MAYPQTRGIDNLHQIYEYPFYVLFRYVVLKDGSMRYVDHAIKDSNGIVIGYELSGKFNTINLNIIDLVHNIKAICWVHAGHCPSHVSSHYCT